MRLKLSIAFMFIKGCFPSLSENSRIILKRRRRKNNYLLCFQEISSFYPHITWKNEGNTNDSEFMKEMWALNAHTSESSLSTPMEEIKLKVPLWLRENVSARRTYGVILHHSQDSLGKLPFIATVYQSPTSSHLNFSTGFSDCT